MTDSTLLPAPGRLIAIGDIHGNAAALETLLNAIEPRSADTIVTLGDYIDRGPQTRRVMEILLSLGDHCRFIPIMGNHEETLLSIVDQRPMRITFSDWLSFGGWETLHSYHTRTVSGIPDDHLKFLRSCASYYATDDFFFTHALYESEIPLRNQSRILRWGRFMELPDIPGPHVSGRRAIVGHTAQLHGQIVVLDHFVCLDSCCYGPDGFLTAMDVRTGDLWQSDSSGRMRENVPPETIRR